MKRKISLLFALALCISGYAQDKVVVTTTTGQQTYSSEAVKTITFDGNTMKVNKVDGSTSDIYQLADVQKITFDLTTGISNVAIGEKLSVYSPAGSNVLYIKGYNTTKNYTVSLYDVSGKAVKNLAKWAGEPIDVSSLPKGVYILKVNNSTIKFRK